MAERDIVGGMFGMTPEMYQRNLAARETATNAQLAGLTPGQLAGFYAMEAGTGLGRAAQGLLGVEDPQLQAIRDISAMRQQYDTSTVDGLRQFAGALSQKGYSDFAMQAAQKAADLEQTMAVTGLRRAQAEKATTSPSVSPEQLLTSGRYTPASVAKYQASGNIADLVLSKEATGGADGAGAGPGPVGKAGAFRDVDGNILGATEMKNIRTEFTEGQKLLKMLNDATAKDIKDAESFIDWTTAGITKGLASSKTLNAQTKIAAAQLIEQIGNLPPGSASDADMRASMKSFPGYSDPESLRQWVNRTKEKLQSRMEDISGQFGFKQRVVSSGEIKFDKPASKKATTTPADSQDADSLVNKYLTPKR